MPIYDWLTHIGQLAKQICVSGPNSCRLLTDCPPKHPTMRSPRGSSLPHWSVAMDKSHLHSDRGVAQAGFPNRRPPGNEELPQSPNTALEYGRWWRREKERGTRHWSSVERNTLTQDPPDLNRVKTHRRRQAPSALGELRCHWEAIRGWKFLLNQGNPQVFCQHGFPSKPIRRNETTWLAGRCSVKLGWERRQGACPHSHVLRDLHLRALARSGSSISPLAQSQPALSPCSPIFTKCWLPAPHLPQPCPPVVLCPIQQLVAVRG